MQCFESQSGDVPLYLHEAVWASSRRAGTVLLNLVCISSCGVCRSDAIAAYVLVGIQHRSVSYQSYSKI